MTITGSVVAIARLNSKIKIVKNSLYKLILHTVQNSSNHKTWLS